MLGHNVFSHVNNSNTGIYITYLLHEILVIHIKIESHMENRSRAYGTRINNCTCIKPHSERAYFLQYIARNVFLYFGNLHIYKNGLNAVLIKSNISDIL